jgi:hypothetical protein
MEPKKIAIVGFAASYREAPFDDPTVEIWGMNELWKYLPRWDRWFELHPREVFAKEGDRDQAAHEAWLQAQPADKPIYMIQRHPDIPGSVPYPLAEMSARFFPGQDRPYFTSSIAFMLALAIAEGATWIGVYGIDLASDTEYANQRAAAEYFIGIARGLGITVVIAAGSALLKTAEIYGFEQRAQVATRALSRPWLQARIAELVQQRDKVLSTLQTFDGALQEANYHLKLVEAEERGVTVATLAPTGVLP